ncbi:hypothetical protein HID58_074003, partial [Brassica napus]
SDVVQTSLVVPRDPTSWIKPPPGHLKCNIGVSWVNSHENCGARWILRDEKDILIAPSEFSEMGHFTNDIHFHLSALQDWSFHHCEQKRNVIAQELATSVTTDHRYHSYIVLGGPTWLLQRIVNEALT